MSKSLQNVSLWVRSLYTPFSPLACWTPVSAFNHKQAGASIKSRTMLFKPSILLASLIVNAHMSNIDD